MSKPPQLPYPPDPADDAPRETVFGDLVDVVATDRDWANRRAFRFSAQRVGLRRCRLTGSEGDVLENAALFATALGLEIVD